MRRQVEAKNSLENYAFTMRNTIRDEKALPGATVLRACAQYSLDARL